MQYPFSERMKKVKRVIIHSDINNCYASIERQLNPSLAGKPIAVCGAAEERHGIVLAKSMKQRRLEFKQERPSGRQRTNATI